MKKESKNLIWENPVEFNESFACAKGIPQQQSPVI